MRASLFIQSLTTYPVECHTYMTSSLGFVVFLCKAKLFFCNPILCYVAFHYIGVGGFLTHFKSFFPA